MILQWFLKKKRNAAKAKAICSHGKTRKPFTVIILGKECRLKSSKFCKECTEKYLNQYSTLCASCEKPILPGTPVSQAWVDAPYPYTHMYDECSFPGLYCGRWGEGRLITLHELNPEKYPEGTTSMVSSAFHSGKTVIEHVNE